MMNHPGVQPVLKSAMEQLVGIIGLVVARTDGRPVAHILRDGNADATGAIAASSFQLARRLGDLLGDGALSEMTVRTADGYVMVYSLGTEMTLTVLTVSAANVARIHLAMRDIRPVIEESVAA